MDKREKIMSEMSKHMRSAVAITIACDGDMDIESLELMLAYDKGQISREEMITGKLTDKSSRNEGTS